ncbi:hypothetical protein MTCOM_06000 [Moorella thermoacetica]|uniref:hypothetical protein n=1 Tax=Neomoorella thermoacetica TaxID=1525 RepID=UPI0030CFD76F
MKKKQLSMRKQQKKELLTLKYKYYFIFMCVLLVMSYLFLIKPQITGDGFEYSYMLQAWFDHFSPDLRSEDIVNFKPILLQNNLQWYTTPYQGFFKSIYGQYFSWHFWLYPLMVLPAKVILWLTNGNQLAAFQTTNIILFLIAIYVALFKNKSNISRRLVFVLLSIANPVIWYIGWTHPEVYSWSFVIISLVFINNKNYWLAALCAAVAAVQNPPILFLALFIVFLSLKDDKSLRKTLFTLVAASVSFLPNIFYLIFYHQPNLIIAYGGTNFSLISFERTWSFLTDFNQGMLPYIPLTLVLMGITLYQIIVKKDISGIGLTITVILMILFSESTTNWNAGSTGIIRYAVWIIPVFAFLISNYVIIEGLIKWLIIGAIVSQILILIFYYPGEDYVHQRPLASFILSEVPYIYNPDFEIFAERQIHEEGDYRSYLPIGFTTKDGLVTKILTDNNSIKKLPWMYSIDQGYYQVIKNKYVNKEDLFYLTPPKGKVKTKKINPYPSAEIFNKSIKLNLVEVPRVATSQDYIIKVNVYNAGNELFWGQGSETANPLNISYHILQNEKMLIWDGLRSHIPPSLGPGETVNVPLKIKLPEEKGEFTIEIAPVLELIAWGSNPLRLKVNVQESSPSDYRAVISQPKNPTNE